MRNLKVWAFALVLTVAGFVGSAYAATYGPSSTSNITLGATHVTVSSLAYSSPASCDSQLPYPFNLPVPNAAMVTVRLSYLFPTAPACSGLGCFPVVTLEQNGAQVGGNPTWSFDPTLGFILSYPNSVAVSGTLYLKMHHPNGVAYIVPANGNVTSITVNTSC